MLERVHHGDAAGRRGLALDLHAGIVGQLGQAFHMAPEQRLVGGDHVLAGGEGGLVDLSGGMLAADELDHDVHRGVGHYVVPVGGEAVVGQPCGPRHPDIERAAATDVDIDAVGGYIVCAVGEEELGHAATYRAEADDADADRTLRRLHRANLSLRRRPWRHGREHACIWSTHCTGAISKRACPT